MSIRIAVSARSEDKTHPGAHATSRFAVSGAGEDSILAGVADAEKVVARVALLRYRAS